MARPLPAELGEQIGGYRLKKVIAHGGMGCVYLGRHLVLGRPAAIKVLDGSLSRNVEYIERFLREARIVNDVRHPNIVDIFDFVRQDEPRRVACVMEFLEGPTVEDLVARQPMTMLQAINVMQQLIGALEKVHSQGVIHRDLKPSNVVVIGDPSTPLATIPSVKVLDFGIAKVFTGGANRTGPGAMLGTPAYMAPEQVAGDPITVATDVYALGELLFEMISGQRAFAGNARQVLKLKMIGQPPEFAFDAHVPEQGILTKIITRTLEADPQRRPTLEEIDQALHTIRLALPTEAPSAPRTPPPERPVEPESEAGTTTPPPAFDALEPTPAVQTMGAGDVKRLGDYSLFIALPPRGMTQSYIARRDGTVEICLLRRLLRQLEANDTATARFRREAKITEHLRHPRIARMLDARVIDGTFCIANEVVLGVTLETLLDRLKASKTPMPLQVFGRIALATLDALHFAHQATDHHGRPLGIVHRDLNPNSIALSFSGDLKLQDFGVARGSVDDFRTAPGTAVGSLEYMSPEQVRSEVADRRSDVYTMAAVMFEALAGRKLIEPKGVLETLRSVTTDVPPPLISLRPDIPTVLAAVVERGLAKRREDRFQTAQEMSIALAAALGAFASASRDVVGDFVRQLMPDEEQKTLEMLGHVRALGERGARIESDHPPHEPTMTVRQRKHPPTLVPIDPTDANEPDLLTMPGAPAPLETSAQAFVLPPPRPPKPPPRNWPRIAVTFALLIAAMAIVIVLVRTTVPSSRSGEVRAETPLPQAEAAAPTARATARPAPPATPAPTERRAPPPRTAPPRPAPPPRAATSNKTVRAPPPPPPASPPPTKSSFGALTNKVQQLRGDSGNVELFDQVHGQIWKAARDLPSSERGRVKIKLDAAQRTYAVDDLEAALDRLKIATQR